MRRVTFPRFTSASWAAVMIHRLSGSASVKRYGSTVADPWRSVATGSSSTAARTIGSAGSSARGSEISFGRMAAGASATTSPKRSSCLSATSGFRLGRVSERRYGNPPPFSVTAVRREEVGVLVGEQGRRPSCWSQQPSRPGAENADPPEQGIAWMVVSVSPPAKRAAPRRADRFGATADADPGHWYCMNAGGGSLGDRAAKAAL